MTERKRRYNQGGFAPSIAKKTLWNVYKQSATITSQASFSEQMSHLTFAKAGIRNKQIKTLLEDYPEHFIVNEGKDAKKFYADASTAQSCVSYPPIFVAWPSYALLATESDEISAKGGKNPTALYHSILLACARFNNQNTKYGSIDSIAGMQTVEQERFNKKEIQVKLPLLLLILTIPSAAREATIAKHWLLFERLTVTPQYLRAVDFDPVCYLFDNTQILFSGSGGPYAQSNTTQSAGLQVSMILCFYLQLAFLIEKAKVFDNVQDDDMSVFNKMNAIILFVKQHESTADFAGYQQRQFDLAKEFDMHYVNVVKNFLAIVKKDIFSSTITTASLQTKQNKQQFFVTQIETILMIEQILETQIQSFSPRVTVLFQMQGIHKTPGFGLLHVTDRQVAVPLTVGAVTITPESRQYLQLSMNTGQGVQHHSNFPASSQAVFVRKPDQMEKQYPQPWVYDQKTLAASKFDNSADSLSTTLKNDGGDVILPVKDLNTIQFIFYTFGQSLLTQAQIKDDVVLEQRVVQLLKLFDDQLEVMEAAKANADKWARDIFEPEILTIEIISDLTEKSIFPFLQEVFKKIQEEYLKQRAMKEAELRRTYLQTVKFQLELQNRSLSVNYSVFDKVSLMRATDGYMENESAFYNAGYSKLTSSVDLSVKCSTACYGNNYRGFGGTFSTMSQQARVLAETFRYPLRTSTSGAKVQYAAEVEAPTYGSLLQTLMSNSSSTNARDNIYQSQYVKNFSDMMGGLSFWESLATPMDSFASQLPTLFTVRYDQQRLSNDQKIPSSAEDLKDTLVDRLIYMEPSLNYLDTFSMGKVLKHVIMLINQLPKKDAMAGVQAQESAKNFDFEAGSEKHWEDVMQLFGSELIIRACESFQLQKNFHRPYRIGQVQIPYDDAIVYISSVFDVAYLQFFGIEMPGAAVPIDQWGKRLPNVAVDNSDAMYAKQAFDVKAFIVSARRLDGVANKFSFLHTQVSIQQEMLKRPHFHMEDLSFYTHIMGMTDKLQTLTLSEAVPPNLKDISYRLGSYVQTNHYSVFHGFNSDVDFDFEQLQAEFEKTWFSLLPAMFKTPEDMLKIMAIGKLMKPLFITGMSLTVSQVVQFFSMVAAKQKDSTKRYLVRLETPSQRIAFSDYIETVQIVSFTSSIVTRTHTVNFGAMVTRQTQGKSPEEKVLILSALSGPFKTSFAVPGQTFYQSEPTGPDLTARIMENNVQIPRESNWISVYARRLDVGKESSPSLFQYLSRHQWQVKSSVTYTRKSTAPGVQLLRFKRDLTDQIQILHPTVRVLTKKVLNSTYQYRDVVTHLAQDKRLPMNSVLREPKPMFASGNQLPDFDSKTVEMYQTAYVSSRIVRLLQTNATQAQGMTSKYERHVGIPFFTPVTRLHLLNDAAKNFQWTFSTSRLFGGLPATGFGGIITQDRPVLGCIFTNLIPIVPKEATSYSISRFASAWCSAAQAFFDRYVPAESDLDAFRTYKSKYDFPQGAVVKWSDVFPAVPDLGDQAQLGVKQWGQKLVENRMDRVRYIMQGSMYDFSVIFKDEFDRDKLNDGEVTQLYASALVYKETLSKFLTSVKMTVQMYPDNPFLIEAFAQVHFQSGRQRVATDRYVRQFNTTVPDVDNVRKIPEFTYLSSFDDTEIDSLKGFTPKFQHFVVSVFVEQMLTRQGCPTDPYAILKNYVLDRLKDFSPLIALTFDAPKNQPIRALAEELGDIILVKKGNDRYGESFSQFEARNKQLFLTEPAIGTLSFWDKYQVKFIGDPQLLMEVFMETPLLAGGYDNTDVILTKLSSYKQSRYQNVPSAAQSICPQFCSFRNHEREDGLNLRATLMDHALAIVNQLGVKYPRQPYSYKQWVRNLLHQIVKDVLELGQFVVNLFTMQLSGYSRGQTKGVKDSENFQLLKMIQSYAQQLVLSMSIFNKVLVESLNEELTYKVRTEDELAKIGEDEVKRQFDDNNMQDEEIKIQQFVIPQRAVLIATAKELIVNQGKLDGQYLLPFERNLLSQRLTAAVNVMRTLVAVEVYAPRRSNYESINEVNKLVRDTTQNMRAKVTDDIRFDSIAQLKMDVGKRYMDAQKTITLDSDTLSAFANVLTTMITGLQIVQKNYIFADGEFSTVQIEVLPMTTMDDYTLLGKTTDTSDYNILSGRIGGGYSEASYKKLIWKHIQKRMSDFQRMSYEDRMKKLSVIDTTYLRISVDLPSQGKMIATTWKTLTLIASQEQFA